MNLLYSISSPLVFDHNNQPIEYNSLSINQAMDKPSASANRIRAGSSQILVTISQGFIMYSPWNHLKTVEHRTTSSSNSQIVSLNPIAAFASQTWPLAIAKGSVT